MGLALALVGCGGGETAAVTPTLDVATADAEADSESPRDAGLADATDDTVVPTDGSQTVDSETPDVPDIAFEDVEDVDDVFEVDALDVSGDSTGADTEDGADVSEPPPCHFPTAPGTPYRLEPAYPNLDSFNEPVGAVFGPGGAVYVLGRLGVIWRFVDSPAVTAVSVALDLTDVVDAGGDSGLLGLAFHPDFSENGEVYISYTRVGGTAMLSRLSRFLSTDGGLSIDPTTELVLLEIDQDDPAKFHSNGAVRFGEDGYLYAAFGDGGPQGDPAGIAQDLSSLRGKFVRLDVDSGEPYSVPPDNPFVAVPNARPEIWAYGFRNPWQWHLEPGVGRLFAGDVGWDSREELNRVFAGKNHGWPVLEGTLCWGECDDFDSVVPLVEYDHEEGRAITGGPVYHGTAFPELVDHVLFADFVRGFIWAVPASGGERFLVADTGRSIVSFTTQPDGEVLAVDYFGGGLLRLVPGLDGPPMPETLSATGCADATEPWNPSDAFVDYSVASPLWSDGASKRRYIRVPEGTTGTWAFDGDLVLPEGSVIWKDFAYGLTRLETRLYVRHETGWAGYTYQWDSGQEDASLVPTASVPASETYSDGTTWSSPTRQQCRDCHTSAAGTTLGLNFRQLGYDTEQLEALVSAGVAPQPPSGLGPVLPNPYDPEVSLENRARSYLHANCAHCHRPGTLVFNPLDLRYTTPLAESGLCDVGWGWGGPLIVPGDVANSAVTVLMQELGTNRMPPIGRYVVDDAAVNLVETWILSLETCP